MTIRVTTLSSFNAGVGTLQQRQRDMAQSQEQLTSGKRVQRASDDPTAAARSERALVSIARSESDVRALEASRNALTLTERALADASDLMQQVRELALSAGNASYSQGERDAVAVQLEGLRTQLLAVANRTDDSGGYLFFPGRNGGPPPLAAGDIAGGVPVQLDPAYVPQPERQTAGREPMPLNVDGLGAWRIDPATGQSAVFDGIDRAIGELRDSSATAPGGAAIAAAAVSSVDASFTTLNLLRARAGELLNRGDLIEGRLADLRLSAQTERSSAEDLDLVQAISEFQAQQSGYDAALKTYSMVQRMSLFQYLNG
jgi:flagellar hook-associated protein 3 FlgL